MKNEWHDPNKVLPKVGYNINVDVKTNRGELLGVNWSRNMGESGGMFDNYGIDGVGIVDCFECVFGDCSFINGFGVDEGYIIQAWRYS